MSELSDYEINKYINEALTELMIKEYENKILAVMKHRQEKYPSEKNDKEWLDFTNFICGRRFQQIEKNKKYFREKFKKVIENWFNTCQISVLGQLDVGDTEKLLNDLLKCFDEDEK